MTATSLEQTNAVDETRVPVTRQSGELTCEEGLI